MPNEPNPAQTISQINSRMLFGLLGPLRLCSGVINEFSRINCEVFLIINKLNYSNFRAKRWASAEKQTVVKGPFKMP